MHLNFSVLLSRTRAYSLCSGSEEPPTAIKMCRYQDWEDDLPDSEVHDEYPGRDAVTAFIRQIELQMNEIRGFLDNMKADSSKKPNKFWSGFLSGVCFTILLNYVIKYVTSN